MALSDSLGEAVCMVTGGAGTAGRGIAAELAAAGAIVYITGRNADKLEQTVAEIRSEGGECRMMRCDHTIDEQVAAVFDEVRQSHGQLDVLVNNAWGGYEQREGAAPFFDAPFWEQPLWRWEGMFTAGVGAGFVSSRCAAPLMLDGSSLIVNT
jgi:NAD(P)-dependent dehydrogenase (short-subunit alcohol dehydrogenase family)